MDETSLTQNEINALSEILEEAGYMPGKNLSWAVLSETPEFMVLALILVNDMRSVSTEELEQVIPQSLAMVLSNLAADDIIVQSATTYRWAFSPRIDQRLKSAIAVSAETVVEPKEPQSVVQSSPSIDIQLFAMVLEGTSYISGGSINMETTEGEIIRLLLEYKAMGNEELEKYMSDSSSLSLALSNLQADMVIKQNSDYSWSLHPNLLDRFEEIRNAKQAEIEASKIEAEEMTNIESGRIVYIDNRDYLYLIEAIKDSPYLADITPSKNLIEIPEFEVLALLYKHDNLTTSELEKMAMSGSSLSLALSNLKADRLVTNDFDTWRLDRALTSKIDEVKRSHTTAAVVKQERAKEAAETSKIERRNFLIRHILSSLERLGIQYTSNERSAFAVPEIEILYHLVESDALTTSELENLVKNTSSLSLVLSNLQADRVISQDTNYRWVLTSEIKGLIENATKEEEKVVRQVVQSENIHSTEALREKEILSEKLKLRKILYSMGVIDSPEIPLPELLKRIDFEILSIILHNQPIETGEIEQELSRPVLLSMELSNLAADDMIYYSEGESKWRISVSLQSKLRKTILDEKEIIAELSTVMDEERPEETTTTKSSLSDLDRELVRILSNSGYPVNLDMDGNDLNNVPEFAVFKLICKHGPIDLSTLTEKTSGLPGLTLTLSNLKADNIVIEENYQYLANPSIVRGIDRLKDTSFQVESIEESKESNIEKETDSVEVEDKGNPEIQAKLEEAKRKAEEQRKRDAEERKRLAPFIGAVHQLGYITSPDLPHSAHLETTEYEVLFAIFEADGSTIDTIKQRVGHSSPVMVSRMFNKLEADGVISISEDKTVHLTPKFRSLLG